MYSVGERSHRSVAGSPAKGEAYMPQRKAAAPVEEVESQVDETEETEDGDEGTKPAKQQIREAFQAGRTRREIADEFSLSYQRVYQVTKDMTEGAAQSRTRVMVEASENLTKAEREDLIGTPRVEAIRSLFDEGMKVGDIARLLDCSYQVVFQATRAQRAALEDGADESEDTEVEGELESEDEDEEEDEDEDEPASE
jgi:DNA-binding NarL/FixJ family response regulator